MPHKRILAIVQAGGAGSRMDVLTRERAKPALPFAGIYQLIDFSLSNLAHSGITDVWLSVQFQGSTLEEQVANGRPWDLDRNRGGLRLLMPQEGTGSTDEEGFAHGQRRRAVPAPRPDPRRGPGVRRRDERRPRLQVRLPRCRSPPTTSSGPTAPWSPPRSRSARPATTRSCEVGDDRRVTGFEYKPERAADVDGGRRDHRLRPEHPGRDAGAAAPRARGRLPRGRQRPGRLRRPPAPPARRAAPRGGPPAGGLLARPRRAAQVRRRPPRRSCSTTSGSSATRTGRS